MKFKKMTRALCACAIGGSISMSAMSTNVQITQYGDSTTNGIYAQDVGKYAVSNPTPSQMLERSLQKEFGPAVTVVFSAQRGASLRDMLTGRGNFTLPLIDAIKLDRSPIVTIKFGVNDEGQYDAETFRVYLTQTVEIMLAAGKEVVLEEQNPTLNHPHDNGAAYARTIGEVAAAYNLPLVKTFAETLHVEGREKMMSDSLHPNPALYQIISDQQVPVIGPMVARRLACQERCRLAE